MRLADCIAVSLAAIRALNRHWDRAGIVGTLQGPVRGPDGHLLAYCGDCDRTYAIGEGVSSPPEQQEDGSYVSVLMCPRCLTGPRED